jgi:hypothetical protein
LLPAATTRPSGCGMSPRGRSLRANAETALAP